MLNKKIISIILILAMMFSISANSLTVFAENTENQEIAETSDEIESVSDNISDDINAESTEGENTTNTADTLSTSENEITLMSSGVSFAGGSGTEEDPYQVSTPEQLNEVRNNLDKYFIQINDIDMSESTSKGGIYWNEGKGWTPIGGYGGSGATYTFKGEYDGGGYSVIGLYGSISSAHSLALFYQVDKLAVISNLKMDNSNLTNTYGEYCSGITVINSGTIKNCVFEGNITAAREAGGIAGCNYGIIKNSYNLGDIKSSRDAGGIASENFYGIITDCYNNGNISGGESSGGIANYNAGEIRKCYNTGNVIIYGKAGASLYLAGGICAGEGTVSGVLVEGVTTDIKIDNCFNIGNIKATFNTYTGTGKITSYLGGIVGQFSCGTIQKCYNTGNMETLDTSNRVGGIVGYAGIGTTGVRLSVYDCYNTGNWNASEEKFGGIVGGLNAWSKAYLYRCYSTGKSDYGCFSNYDTDVTTYSCYVLDTSCNRTTYTIGTLITELQLKDKNTYISSGDENEKFDFDTVWDISADKNNGYPFLRDMPTTPHTHIWGEWTITQEPTQIETGLAERVCEDDSSHTETAVLPVLTDDSVWTLGTRVESTCESTGSQEYTSIYGKVVETISATGHAWGAWNITNKPTKTETGTAERVCGNDSRHKDRVTLPKLTDDSVWTIGAYVAPTCEGTGSQEYISSVYGTVTETISATGHAWGAWNITKKPTQTESGTAERICGNDSSHKETATLPKLTDSSVWTKGAYVAPTCENTGSQEYVSSVYGTVTETIPATGHAWGAWSITTKPTKTETGVAERICGNNSSHKDTATLPVLTDTTVWTVGAYVAPTCENTGSQEYISLVYGIVIETIPATGHSWGAWNITVKPTKTETGTAERFCSNDSSHKDTVTLPKLTDDSVWTIGAYVAPTCEDTGSQEYISSTYGNITEIIPETGHSWGAWNITTKPTKTETGVAERICGNDSSHKDTATLPVLTDTAVWTVGAYVAPTCEGSGSQEYISSTYGNITEIIPATGHAWGDWNITTKPTKTETGVAERICGNNSSHKDTATLPILTDTTVWTVGAYVAPTCENTGSQEYTSIYGKVVETISATGHAWGDWNITNKPTKTETGTAERICGNDNSHKDTVTLPKLTDDSVWTIGAYVAPTCEDTGSQEYISTVYGKVVETIPATGHSWGAWSITTKPTKTETGIAERICGNDSSHKDTATLPVLTDTTAWTIGAYVAPTCENTGSQEYISSVYGTVVEIISALGHSFNILQHDDTKHWYKCERCTAINNEEKHKGGQATKTEKAVCSVCNTPYGKLLPNYVLPTDLKTTYGKTLSDIILPAGWKWTDSSIIPTVINNGYEAYYTIDNDTDYDWTKENGYDASANQIKLDLTVNVEKAEQDISYAINSINKYTTDSAFTNELTKNIVQGALSFSSSNENVAIVDNNGLVTIKGAGTAIITATVSETENYNSKSTSYTINVKRYSSHSGGGGSSTSYTISFDTNGGTQIDSVRVRRNGLLKEPESPVKAGYMFDGWYSDKELSVKYDFASKVTKSFTLYAKWHEEKSDNNHSGISDWDNPFKDVHKNDWFYDSVKYVYINGMMKGVASDLFAPDGNITRAMFITVLYRIENEPDTECDNSFNDVEANSYYEKAVYWGRKNGIVKGITNTEYAPDLNITREQMAAMIYRYMTYKNMDLSVGENTNILSYADCSNISDYAIPAMQYAIGSGIIKGMTDNTLEPQGISTRAQAATVFMRTFNLLKNTEI